MKYYERQDFRAPISPAASGESLHVRIHVLSTLYTFRPAVVIGSAYPQSHLSSIFLPLLLSGAAFTAAPTDQQEET